MITISKHARAGFSLIEIMVAIVIVGIMGAIAVPMYLRYQKQAEGTKAKTELRNLEQAVENFRTDTGSYPETLQDLLRKPMNEELAQGWDGPYLKGGTIPKDPWRQAYQYNLTPGAAHEYELYSYGPKKKAAPQAEWISVHSN